MEQGMVGSLPVSVHHQCPGAAAAAAALAGGVLVVLLCLAGRSRGAMQPILGLAMKLGLEGRLPSMMRTG